MEILFFGIIKEKVGISQLEVAHSKISLGQLKQELEQQFEFLTVQPYRFAVNETVLQDMNHMISQDDVIALLPPFSGG